MTYVFYPVRNGVVVDGAAVAAGYSAESQREARADCLAQNPDATGTARAWVGIAGSITPGDIAGHDLDVERPRPLD